MKLNRDSFRLRNLFFVIVVFWSSSLCANESKLEYRRPANITVPSDNQLSQERIDLGKLLFFEPRLSGSNKISCASCHKPEKGWSDGLPTAVNESMTVLTRATPTLFNVAYQRHYMWDGQFRHLEQQALVPIASPLEMNQNLDKLVSELGEIPAYSRMFAIAYPNEGLTVATIAKALASFERTVVVTDAPFDRWVNGDEQAISESAKRGFALFVGKANCAACHHGFNFTDDGFHNIGLTGGDDLGRFMQVPISTLRGAFKTPTLRGITHTAPYMHNGIYNSLEAVIEHYDRGGDVKAWLDPSIRPLFLTAKEKQELLELLGTFTGETEVFVQPELP
ncbi:MAG: tryptophan tryptophylquinone biosynthesis enzyme MauG [Gammaproteobacteria bacterium]|nr:tryptophan tryptophylquinone biosynthesis enzyme MauG [Gammaproteobacteria bacterium]